MSPPGPDADVARAEQDASPRLGDPVQPAHIEFDEHGVPWAPDYGDVYHPRQGALEQARHVFLAGCGLPERWQGRERFVVLETGFGLGHNFLATWDAWRADPRRCERLWFLSVERHPLRREDLARVHRHSPLPELADALVRAWPPLTPDLHTLAFDDGRVMLQVVFADARPALRELRLSADAIYLDGFAPSRNPAMWNRHLLRAVGRLAAPQARAATWSVARELREGLAAAGFEVVRAPGFGDKREMCQARFAPRGVHPPRPGRAPSAVAPLRAGHERELLIVGAGLAGAACAWALAAEGFDCTVLERHGAPAQEASGNEAGLFHGALHAQDGLHARFNRHAALLAQRLYGPALADGSVPGRSDGLLRLETGLALPAMQALLARLGLPADYVQALSAEQASQRAGVALGAPAWFYPGGGWLDPRALVAHWLAGARIRLRGSAAVHRIEHDGHDWLTLDEHGRALARAPRLVLANGCDAARLLGADWPLRRQRGQLSRVAAGTPGLRRPRLPVAGGGYALSLPDGSLLCGASASFDDEDGALRDSDHAHNLDRLGVLTGSRPQAEASSLSGRVGWRCLADDRLPVVGAVPVSALGMSGPAAGLARRGAESGTEAGAEVAPQAGSPAPLRVIDVARTPGLFVCTGLGSRGIAWAPTCAALVATWAGAAPSPLPNSLADALDPARFGVRRARREVARQASGASGQAVGTADPAASALPD